MDRSRYPANWTQIADAIRERDGHVCKFCQVPNKATIIRNGMDGRWMLRADYPSTDPVKMRALGPGWNLRSITVVLTVAHLHNPDPMDVRDENLAALCQRCHNRHDAPMRAANAKATRERKAAAQARM